MKKPLKYLGSKAASGAFQAVISNLPAHETFIEAFLGSGAIMRRKPASHRSIGIDLDKRLLDPAQYPGVELHCCDAVEYLKSFDYAGAGRVCVYADPPYILSTRKSKSRYKFEYTDEDHIRLIECLKSLPESVSVCLSGYPSALYDELLTEWRTIEFQVRTRGCVATEKLWMNYGPDSAHWATYAGKNFTERQRIKRKAKRWATNYAGLNAKERVAILAALLEQEAKTPGEL